MILDIISPLYHSKRLYYLLESIASSNYTSEVIVTLVSDGDNENYSSTLKQFENKIKINYLSYSKNQGPSIARQYGLDHSSAPFIMFIDSDDIFLSKGLDILIETIKSYPDNYLYLFDFIENKIVHSKIDHFGCMGQVYARNFLKLYNIQLPTEQPYYLDDYGFNIGCMFILKYYKLDNRIYHITTPLTENVGPGDSLTRKNHDEFIYKNWARGAAWNTKYAIELALKNGVSDEFLLYDASKIMSEQCWFYYKAKMRHPEYCNDILEGSRYYYNTCYKLFEKKFGTQLSENFWINDHGKRITSSPKISDFIAFLNLCKEVNI